MVITPKARIAVIDDDLRVLEAITELLESDGHTVRAFPSARSFLDEDILSEIDCMITDVAMPVVNGFDLRCLAREKRPGIPVIFVTARDEAADLRRAISGGHHGFFHKPFDGYALLEAIEKAIRPGDQPPNTT
jgi:FixJ family two-component response regulator